LSVATVTGVKFKVSRFNAQGYGTNGGSYTTTSDRSVRLVQNGAVVGNNVAAGDWPSGYSTVEYGGNISSWGNVSTITPEMLDDTGFGLAISVLPNQTITNVPTLVAIEEVTLTVYFTTPAP
jgi:hypothetical protein